MEKLKILLIMLTAAASGLAISLFLLMLNSAPNMAPLDLLFATLAEGPLTDVPFFAILAPLLFFITVLASVVGVVYFLVIPEIRTYYETAQASSMGAAQMIMRTLKPDEQRVIRVLEAHGGRYLQKYISKEAELSKLKTHRTIARFAERGIVRVEKRGNTNEVCLANWFHPEETCGR